MPGPHQREFLPQLTLQGRVKENAAGGETISFIIPLGPLQLICIANIPQDSDSVAPVYVKFKIDVRKTQQWINNMVANMANRTNGHGRRGSEDDYEGEDYPSFDGQ